MWNSNPKTGTLGVCSSRHEVRGLDLNKNYITTQRTEDEKSPGPRLFAWA